MKKYLLISSVFFLFISCKIINNTTNKNSITTVNIISYCKIIDSIRLLPKYNYSLVKNKTVFISSDYEDSEQRKKEVEAKGLRGVIMDRVEDPYLMDSIAFIRNYYYDAHTIFRRQIADSLFRIDNKKATNNEVEQIAIEKLKKENCFKNE